MKRMGRLIKGTFKLGFFIMICVGLLYVYARYIEPNTLIVVTEVMAAERLEKDMRVVLFADTHIGELYDQTKLESIVAKINQQEPDIVIFAGDFFDSYQRDMDLIDKAYIIEQLSEITATEGKIAVWGNHDKGGSYQVYEEVMTESGFLLLTNEDFYIEEYNLCIRGLDDYLLGTPDLDTSTLEESYYNLIVIHEPDVSDAMDWSKVDLILAGHSHGGQVYIPKLTSQLLPTGATKYVKGLFEAPNERNTKLYVTKGIGVTQIPYRFMNVPEIVVIDLEADG
ncbi:MAG: metallophosphoesterase [Eubacteriales bacterium]